MVQYFQQQKQPTAGELIGQAVGQGLGGGLQAGLTKGIESYYGHKKSRNALAGLKPLFKQAGINLSPEDEESFIESGIDPKVAADFASDIIKNKKVEDTSELQGLSNTLDELDNLVEYTGKEIPGFKSATYGGLNRKAVEKREQIDKMGFFAADKIFTQFNKGTVSIPKFEQIKKELAPNSKLSEREYKARVNALRLISNLPRNTSQKSFDKIVDKQIAKVNKISGTEKKPISEDLAREILRQNNNDIEASRKMAKSLGYEF